jgi:hypothetical protein
MGREAEAHRMKEEILSIIEKRQSDDVTDTPTPSSTPTKPPPTPINAKVSLEDDDISVLPEKKEVKKVEVLTHPPHMRAANRKKRSLT